MMSGSLRTYLSLLRLTLILFIVVSLFVVRLTFHLCPQRPHDHGTRPSRLFQTLHPDADLCRDIHSSLRALKSVFRADQWQTSTRPPVHNEHHQSTGYPDTVILTMHALSDFTSCYVEHGNEDFTRVTLRGRRARCSRSITHLFELATTPEGYIALHHHVDKELSSDRRIELERCYETLGSLSQGNKDLCLRRFFKDPKLLPTAECTDRWEFKLAVLHHLASCDLRSSELQLCAARQILHVIEEYPGCQVRSDHVAAPKELQKREDLEILPLFTFPVRLIRRFYSNKFAGRLSACLAEKVQASKSISVKEEDNEDEDSQHCKEVEAREKAITIVLTTVFVLLGVVTSICVVLQVVRRKPESDPADESWESHRTSLQEVNRGVFTETSIPEEEEDNDDAVPTSEISHTQPWYDRLFKRSEKDLSQENQQSQEKRKKLKRRTPPEDVENVFIMPPAPNSRVKKKAPFNRNPLRPINDNVSEDTRGHRISSTGSAHAAAVENVGVRKSLSVSSERSKKRPRLVSG